MSKVACKRLGPAVPPVWQIINKDKNSSSNQFKSFKVDQPAKSGIVWLLGVGCVDEKEEEGEGKGVEDCLRGSSQVASPNQTNT